MALNRGVSLTQQPHVLHIKRVTFQNFPQALYRSTVPDPEATQGVWDQTDIGCISQYQRYVS